MSCLRQYFFWILCLQIVLCPFGYCAKEESFQKAEKVFLQYWNEFGGDTKDFPLWNPEWKKQDLATRFDQLTKERFVEYFVNSEDVRNRKVFGIYKEKYKTPDNWKSWHSRYPYPGAFAYNVASQDYNASLISLRGLHFIAMEGPSKENLKAFLQILKDYDVTHLVRLTPARGENRENSVPYWEGCLNFHPSDARSCLELFGRDIYYFATDEWKDHHGIETGRLCALVNAIKNTYPKVIAVHCRAGVGRTGTFIAAYILAHDIEEQMRKGVSIDHLEISIDKVIGELSLQRPFLVTHFPQYVTLHEFVDDYVSFLRSKK